MAVIWYVKASAVGLNNGTNWYSAYTSLSSALTAASSGDEIWIATGTYSPGGINTSTFQMKNGVNIYGGFSGNEWLRTQKNPNINSVILDGATINYHVVTGPTSGTCTLDGVTIQRGNANGTLTNSKGGGLYLGSYGMTLNNVIFQNNVATGYGGAIYGSSLPSNSVFITNCSFKSNSATGGSSYGGAISLNLTTSFGYINNSIFTSNSSVSAGGGFHCEQLSGSIYNCLFRSNSSGLGSAIGATYVSTASTLALTNTIIDSNTTATYQVDTTSTSSLNLTIKNNDFVQGLSTIGTNVTVTNSGGNISSDPLYKNSAGSDYRLTSTSPCIDAGDGNTAPSTDIRGKSRMSVLTSPTGVGTINYTDIGPYEFQNPKSIYVYLLSTYNETYHTGTIDDPYSYEQFLAEPPDDNTIYYFKGSRTLTASFTNSIDPFEIRAWDINQYGPWRLQGSTSYAFTAPSVSLSGGYLDCTNFSVANTTNMYIYATSNTGTNSVGASSTSNQTTFYLKQSLTIGSGTITITNFIFMGIDAGDKIVIPVGTTLNISTVHTNRTNRADLFTISGTLNDSSITYGQTLPSAPTWSTGTLTAFKLNSLSNGVGLGWAAGLKYFVDFNTLTTGYSGLYGDQYIGWTEFRNIVSAYTNGQDTGVTFYCRGTKILDANFPSTVNRAIYSIKAWDVSAFGPWRLQTSVFTLGLEYTTTENGIIDSRTATICNANRVYVSQTTVSSPTYLRISTNYTPATTVVLTDCTFYAIGGTINVNSGGSHSLDNCVLRGVLGNPMFTTTSGYPISITNSFFNLTDNTNLVSYPADLTESGNTYSWSDPSFPSWTDTVLENFNVEGTPTAVNAGCQNFPTILYVDISNANDATTNTGASIASAMSFYKALDTIKNNVRTKAYLTGYRDCVKSGYPDVYIKNLKYPYGTNFIYSYDNTSSGNPWRIHCYNFYTDGVNLKDGIVYSDVNIYLYGLKERDSTTIEYMDVFFKATGQLFNYSGYKNIKGCNIISQTSPIFFNKNFPDNTLYNTYFTDSFSSGSYDPWYSTDFTSRNTLTKWSTPKGDRYVAVGLYPASFPSYRAWVSPVGANLSGDFIFTMTVIYGPTAGTTTSPSFNLYDATANDGTPAYLVSEAKELMEISMWYPWPTIEVQLDNVWGQTVALDAFTPYREVLIMMVKKGNVASFWYKDGEKPWAQFNDTYTYSGNMAIMIENGVNPEAQIAGFTLQCDSGLPYTSNINNNTLIENSALDIMTASVPSWTFDSITIKSSAQSDTQWTSGTITYSGSNQFSWTKSTSWPSLTDVINNNKDAFAFNLWLSSITTTGDPSLWESYLDGLWGDDRVNIGAFYFGLSFDFAATSSTYHYIAPDNSVIVVKLVDTGSGYSADVVFTPENDIGATDWDWDFGDGGTSSGVRIPTHTYTTEGVYTVSLYIDNNPTNTVTKIAYIIAVKELNLDIVVDPSRYYGALPKTFNFGVDNETRPLDFNSDPPYVGFKWDLNNGDIITGVTGFDYSGYTDYDTYNIDLYVRDVGVSGNDYTRQYKHFNYNLVILNVTIDVDPNAGKTGVIVTFEVTFLGTPPSNLQWNFADGSPLYTYLNPSSVHTTTHTYTAAGMYDTILKLDAGLSTEKILVYDPSDPNLKELRILVSDLEASFTVTPNGGRAPFTGLYENTSIGTISTIHWDFGSKGYPQTIDGPPSTANEVLSTYTGVGTYSPAMTVTDIYGFSDTATLDVTVTPALDISISPTPSNVPQTLYFTPLNDTGVIYWEWQLIYNDPVLGEITIGQYISTDPLTKMYNHLIEAPTTYTIKLKVLDGSSYYSYASKQFTNTENYAINAFKNSENVPSIVQFSIINSDTGYVDYIEWDFGDGSPKDTSNNFTPQHEYTEAGTYTITATLEWNMNEATTSRVSVVKTKTISVSNPALIIDFTRTPSSGIKPLKVAFHGTANNPISSWLWSIDGIGNVGTTQNIVYTFNDRGVYYITLTATDEYGNPPKSITKSVVVYDEINTVDEAVDPIYEIPSVPYDPDTALPTTDPTKVKVYVDGKKVDAKSIVGNQITLNDPVYGDAIVVIIYYNDTLVEVETEAVLVGYKVAPKSGSGNILFIDDVGVVVNLSSSIENPMPVGFKRSSGPTIIFD